MISTYNSNGVICQIEESLEIGLKCGNFLNEYSFTFVGINNVVYDSWKEVFVERNLNYGTATWIDLGLRGIYSFLYAKTRRFDTSPTYFDSIVDIFGYCVLALVYLSKIGVDFSKIEIINLYNRFDLFNEMKDKIWDNDYVDESDAARLFIAYAVSIIKIWESKRAYWSD